MTRLLSFIRAAGCAAAAAAALAAAPPVQSGEGPGTATTPSALAATALPVDTTGMGTGPWSRLSMLYEVTLFNVDVLELEIRVDPGTTARLEGLVAGSDAGAASLPADAVAEAVVRSPGAIVRTRFCRDVSVDRFLSGARENLERARNAGFVSQADADRISGEIRSQFAVLEERGLRDGDTVWYEIRNDSLVMAVQGREGRVLLRDVAGGMDRRSALLGGYLAPGSDFREKLLRSLAPRR